MGSDGLFDNMYNGNIALCLQTLLRKDQTIDATEAATCIANKTQKMAQDESYFSPFAKAALEAKQEHTGGKVDDITVVVAQVHF